MMQKIMLNKKALKTLITKGYSHFKGINKAFQIMHDH